MHRPNYRSRALGFQTIFTAPNSVYIALFFYFAGIAHRIGISRRQLHVFTIHTTHAFVIYLLKNIYSNEDHRKFAAIVESLEFGIFSGPFFFARESELSFSVSLVKLNTKSLSFYDGRCLRFTRSDDIHRNIYFSLYTVLRP